MKKLLLVSILAFGLSSVAYGKSNEIPGRCVNNSRVIIGNDAFPFECQNFKIETSGKYDVIFSYRTIDAVIQFTVHLPHKTSIKGYDFLKGNITSFKINSNNFKAQSGNSQCFLTEVTSSCVATAYGKNKTHVAIFFKPD